MLHPKHSKHRRTETVVFTGPAYEAGPWVAPGNQIPYVNMKHFLTDKGTVALPV